MSDPIDLPTANGPVARPQTDNQRELARRLLEFQNVNPGFGPALVAFLKRDQSVITSCHQLDQSKWSLRVFPAEASRRQFSIDAEIQCMVTTHQPLQPRILRDLDALRRMPQCDQDVAILVAADEGAYGFTRDKKRCGFPVLCQSTADFERGLYASRTLREELTNLLRSVNHFDFSNEITSPADFFGRTDDIDAVLQLLQTGQSVGVFGLRKAGKSSLLHQVRSHLRERDTLSWYVQLNAVQDPDEFRVLLVQGLARAMREAGREVPPSLIIVDKVGEVRRTLQSDWQRRWLSDLGLLLDAASTDAVLVIDEIDLANEEEAYIEDIATVTPVGVSLPIVERGIRAELHGILQQLRGLIQTRRARGAPSLTLLTAGVAASIFSAAHRFAADNQLFEFATIRPLGSMTRGELAEMVRTLGKRSGLRFDEHVLIDDLYTEYGGHPHLTRRSCAFVADHRPAGANTAVPYHVARADLDAAFSSRGENSAWRSAHEVLNSFGFWYPQEADVLRKASLTDAPVEIGAAPHAHDFGLLGSDGHIRVRALLRDG